MKICKRKKLALLFVSMGFYSYANAMCHVSSMKDDTLDVTLKWAELVNQDSIKNMESQINGWAR
ncbi:MAG: hypothetical protein ABIA04_05945 [Pseudomonadota bacterium]